MPLETYTKFWTLFGIVFGAMGLSLLAILLFLMVGGMEIIALLKSILKALGTLVRRNNG